LDSSHIEEIADDVPDAGDRAEAQDDRALLKMALDRLDRDDRDVLLLSRIRNLPFAEVALILECSVGAAKVRAHRALRELRDVFFDLQRKESKP
jgi:RNA polymerase sigma-70 factor (ECF subfamily)